MGAAEQAEQSVKQVEILGLDLLMDGNHFNSCSDTESSSDASSEVDSLELTRRRLPNIIHNKKYLPPPEEKSRRARRRGRRLCPHERSSNTDELNACGEVDSLVLTRRRLAKHRLCEQNERRKTSVNRTETRRMLKGPVEIDTASRLSLKDIKHPTSHSFHELLPPEPKGGVNRAA